MARRKPPPTARRFADTPVMVGGWVVPVLAHTYVHMPPELAAFDPAHGWTPTCPVLGVDCDQPGARQQTWRSAREEWCEANLTFDEAWADTMAVQADHRLPHWHDEWI